MVPNWIYTCVLCWASLDFSFFSLFFFNTPSVNTKTRWFLSAKHSFSAPVSWSLSGPISCCAPKERLCILHCEAYQQFCCCCFFSLSLTFFFFFFWSAHPYLNWLRWGRQPEAIGVWSPAVISQFLAVCVNKENLLVFCKPPVSFHPPVVYLHHLSTSVLSFLSFLPLVFSKLRLRWTLAPSEVKPQRHTRQVVFLLYSLLSFPASSCKMAIF